MTTNNETEKKLDKKIKKYALHAALICELGVDAFNSPEWDMGFKPRNCDKNKE